LQVTSLGADGGGYRDVLSWYVCAGHSSGI
jgi:hypothetical protein